MVLIFACPLKHQWRREFWFLGSHNWSMRHEQKPPPFSLHLYHLRHPHQAVELPTFNSQTINLLAQLLHKLSPIPTLQKSFILNSKQKTLPNFFSFYFFNLKFLDWHHKEFRIGPYTRIFIGKAMACHRKFRAARYFPIHYSAN